jgi:hypothetical protein
MFILSMKSLLFVNAALSLRNVDSSLGRGDVGPSYPKRRYPPEIVTARKKYFLALAGAGCYFAEQEGLLLRVVSDMNSLSRRASARFANLRVGVASSRSLAE